MDVLEGEGGVGASGFAGVGLLGFSFGILRIGWSWRMGIEVQDGFMRHLDTYMDASFKDSLSDSDSGSEFGYVWFLSGTRSPPSAGCIGLSSMT